VAHGHAFWCKLGLGLGIRWGGDKSFIYPASLGVFYLFNSNDFAGLWLREWFGIDVDWIKGDCWAPTEVCALLSAILVFTRFSQGLTCRGFCLSNRIAKCLTNDLRRSSSAPPLATINFDSWKLDTTVIFKCTQSCLNCIFGQLMYSVSIF